MTHAAESLRERLAEAAGFARVPISAFPVGAAVLGASGRVYLGANLEFEGQPLGTAVHAEQAAVSNAWSHGETGILALATTATPCGYCRQFLAELADAPALPIAVAGQPAVTLGDLLPRSFGPADLGRTGRFMDPADSGPAAAGLTGAALAAAGRSYAPYSGALAGIAVELADGSVHTGAGIENAAFNPSLPALQAALVQVALAGRPFDGIRRAVLAEASAPASQRAATEALLAAIAPQATFTYVRAAAPSAGTMGLKR